jgi:hypothetical protein
MEGFRPVKGVVEVPSRTLDTYCDERGVDPSVIKIDVESYESHVVRGAKRVLERARPAVVCEILSGTDRDAVEQTVDAFASLDFHIHRWTRSDAWRECSPRDVVANIAHDGNDWLFTPAEIGSRFRAALHEWREAIAECRAERTVRLPSNPRMRSKYYSLRPLERLWHRQMPQASQH